MGGELLIQIVPREVTTVMCRADVRVASSDQACPIESVSGVVVGPNCARIRCLSARHELVPAKPAGATSEQGHWKTVAAFTIPDPCFWSPEHPLLYELYLRGLPGDVPPQLFGIRPLRIVGRRLRLADRAIVLRGVRPRRLPKLPMELPTWRELGAAVIVSDPPASFCEFSSREGVWMVAELPVTEMTSASLWQIARWPSVAAILVGNSARLSRDHVESAVTTLLVQSLAAGNKRAPWAAAGLWDVTTQDDLPAGAKTALFAQRAAGGNQNVFESRRLCDDLQRDLAGRGEFCGYFV